MKKQILYFNASGFNTLKSSVEKTAKDANNLLAKYAELMNPLYSIDEALAVIAEPLEKFDADMFERAGVDATKIQPNPAKVAELYDFKRIEFVEFLTGKKQRTGCNTCNDVSTLEGYDLNRRFNSAKGFLIFDGKFTADYDKLEQAKEGFTQYATEEQAAQLQWLNSFVNAINTGLLNGFLDSTIVQDIAKQSHLSYLDDTRKLSIPYQFLGLLTKIKHL